MQFVFVAMPAVQNAGLLCFYNTKKIVLSQ
jgi:hypothetical protein